MNSRNDRVLQHTTLKVRLYPTPEQATVIDKTIDCCRYLWNAMLSDEQEFYSATGEHFIPHPARYKRTAPFLKEADSQALNSVYMNLRKTFQAFFDDPSSQPYPVFKRKKEQRNTYRSYCNHSSVYRGGASIRIEGEGIVLPKLKWVRAKLHRKPLHWWKLVYATVSRSACGKYFCSLLYEFPEEKPEPQLSTDKAIGINYSVRHFYVDSSGYAPNPPKWMKESEEKLREMQRRLSRMEQGSNNYQQQLRRIQLLHEHIANQRRDFIHKESRRIANACDIVCVRESNLAEMAKALKMANIYDSGFGRFRDCLRYKLARQGKKYIVVGKNEFTAKTCRFCGWVNEDLPLSSRVWTCPHCGKKIERELNAAVNICNLGLRQLGLAG